MLSKKLNEILNFLKNLDKSVLYFNLELPKTKTHRYSSREKYVFSGSISELSETSKRLSFDLIIYDVKENDEIPLSDQICNFRKQNKTVKIVFLSKQDDFQSILGVYQSGIDIFLPKENINFSYFKTVVEVLLKNYSRIIISKNQELQKSYELLSFYAKKINSDVLLLGKNGTGKGILARAIYVLGTYRGEFIVQNCAGIPDSLFESEMFGYEAGAFTGADRRGKIGVFEKADKGILFLDEIGDLPINQQAKLLRAIQRKVILKVGGIKERKIDIRYIYATNKKLFREVAQGNFREDFYYRLKGAEINIPPLRHTPEDIEIMVAVFTNRFLNEQVQQKDFFNISLNFDSLQNLKRYNFPGNMRELQKIVYQSLINMMIDGSNELILKYEFEDKPYQESDKTDVETFWQIIDLLEKGHLRYGGLIDSMKRSVIDHLRTKYKDSREKISNILGFKDKQSLSNEIYRLGKI